MGLFKSKEQKLKEKEEKEKLKQEQAIQPLIDKGIKPSKIIELPVIVAEHEYRYFVVDTENKKWCYVTKLFNKSKKSYDEIIKIFDFNDFVNYEIVEEKENSNIVMSNLPGSVASYDNSSITKYEAFITTNSKEIDDSSITIPFIWHPVGIIYGNNTPAYNRAKQVADDMKVILEYIKNNK